MFRRFRLRLWVGSLLVAAVGLLLVVSAVQAAGPEDDPAGQDQPSSAYRSLETTFNSRGVLLSGTLVLPNVGDGPYPAVVMLHGSGPDTRQIFWETGDADVFLQAGLAVFLYDKRGTGESGGDWRTASLQDLAADALAAVDLLRTRSEINPDHVGVFGVSQGGWLTPLVAANAPQVDFLINVTGAGVPLANQELWGLGNELRRRGFSDPAVDSAMKVTQLLFSARPLLQSGRLPLGDLYIWFVGLDPYLDPADYWSQVSQPAYVAYGAADALVPTRDSVAVVEPLLAASRHPASRLVVYPQAGHGVRLPSGEWAPGHIQRLTEWVQAVTADRTPAPAPEIGPIDSGEQHWVGLGSARQPWYASFTVQSVLVLFFGLVFGIGLLLALNPRAQLALPEVGSLPRLVLLLASAVNLALLVGLLVVIGFLAFADPNGAGPQVPYAGPLAALAGISVLLAIGLLFFAVRGWGSAGWSAAVRGLYVLAAAAAAGYLPFLLYWNLLGPPL